MGAVWRRPPRLLLGDGWSHPSSGRRAAAARAERRSAFAGIEQAPAPPSAGNQGSGLIGEAAVGRRTRRVSRLANTGSLASGAARPAFASPRVSVAGWRRVAAYVRLRSRTTAAPASRSWPLRSGTGSPARSSPQRRIETCMQPRAPWLAFPPALDATRKGTVAGPRPDIRVDGEQGAGVESLQFDDRSAASSVAGLHPFKRSSRRARGVVAPFSPPGGASSESGQTCLRPDASKGMSSQRAMLLSSVLS
jgi:hypothetical protein